MADNNLDLEKLGLPEEDLLKIANGDMESVSMQSLQKIAGEPVTPQEEPDMEDKAMEYLGKAAKFIEPAQKPLGYAGGWMREAIAKTMLEPAAGKELVTREQAIKGEVPSFSKILEDMGYGPGASLSEKFPEMFSETGKGIKLQKGGMFDVTPRGVAGGFLDILTDPLTYVGPGLVGKAGTAAKAGTVAVAKGAPKYSIMSKLSGIPREAIETYAANADEIKALNPEMVGKMAEDAVASSRTLVTQARRKAGEALGNAAKEAGVASVDITELKKVLKKAKEKARTAAKNTAGEETAAEVSKKVDSIIKRTGEVPERIEMGPDGIIVKIPARKGMVEIPDTITPEELFHMKQQLKEMGDLYGDSGGILSKMAKTNAPLQDKEFTMALTESVNKADSIIDKATRGATKEARSLYKQLSDKSSNIDTYFSSPDRAVRTLSNISSPSYGNARRFIKDADKAFGTNLEEVGKKIESAKYFNDPAMEAISGARSTSTSRTNTGIALGSALGYLLGETPGAVAGAAIGSKAFSPWSVANLQIPASQALAPVIETAAAVSKPAGQAAIKAAEGAEYLAKTKLGKAAGKIPPTVWMKMLKEEQGEQK